MNKSLSLDQKLGDIPDSAIQDFARSFYRLAQEAFARPETQDRYLNWRKEQFLKGNPLGLTPIPEDLIA